MTRHRSLRPSVVISAGCMLWLLTLVGVFPAHSQEPLTTAERVDGPGWWPTKTATRRSDYVGAAACARCHESKAKLQARSAMARTATRAAQSEVLGARPVLKHSDATFHYEVRTAGGRSIYSVSDGSRVATTTLDWALGIGKVGQTFIFARDGTLYEARASYFASLDALHFTPGRARDAPRTVEAAMGRPLTSNEARRCFGCHTTASSVGGTLMLADLIPGVTCEACHGPGRAHTELMDQNRDEEGLAAVVNPARFGAIDSVDFCGACHATFWDVTLAGEKGVAALRSQPYRLQSSRCWGVGDRRITCVACHDPHQPIERDHGFYDARCLRCHVGVAAGPIENLPSAKSGGSSSRRAPSCKNGARERCASCHMPKYNVPEMHFAFTDHLIRIVRAE